MNLAACGFLFWTFSILSMELSASPQITKLVPVEDWIAFKRCTSDIKPLDKFLGKLRATYDFVFHKPDNVSNVEKILTEDTSQKLEEEPEKFVLSNSSSVMDNVVEKQNDEKTSNMVYVELLPVEENVLPTRESSISRISKDNEWLDDIEAPEPLSELEIVDDDNIDRSVENVTPQLGFQLPIAIARAFGKWLGSILGFTRGAYLKLAYSNP